MKTTLPTSAWCALVVGLSLLPLSLGCSSGGTAGIRKDDASGAKGAAGGDTTSAPGSRLVPISYHGNDGSKAFVGWFDKQLGKECAFDRLGSIGVCVPLDVYTVRVDVFSDSLKTASPALYLDPKCGERAAIALDETADCTQYGVIRITNGSQPSDYPGCGAGASSYGTGLAVVTPIPDGTKVYAWGQGGGQCCTCEEWVPPVGGRAYRVESFGDEGKLASIKLVTATIEGLPSP